MTVGKANIKYIPNTTWIDFDILGNGILANSPKKDITTFIGNAKYPILYKNRIYLVNFEIYDSVTELAENRI